MEFLSNLNVKPPLHECKAPPIDDFLATVLVMTLNKTLMVIKIVLTVEYFEKTVLLSGAYARGIGVNPLELDILQNLYYLRKGA